MNDIYTIIIVYSVFVFTYLLFGPVIKFYYYCFPYTNSEMKIKINLFFKKYNYLLEGLCMKIK